MRIATTGVCQSSGGTSRLARMRERLRDPEWRRYGIALRQEWFKDAEGVRTGTVGGVTLFSTTATLQYNIWRGLFARGEYRHDQASQVAFGCRPNTGCSEKSQDTLSVSLYYKFL